MTAAHLVADRTYRWMRAYIAEHHEPPDRDVWAVAAPLELRHPVLSQWNPNDSAAYTVTPDGSPRVFGYRLMFLDLHAAALMDMSHVHVLSFASSAEPTTTGAAYPTGPAELASTADRPFDGLCICPDPTCRCGAAIDPPFDSPWPPPNEPPADNVDTDADPRLFSYHWGDPR